MKRLLIVLMAMLAAPPASAGVGAEIDVCFNYGCIASQRAQFDGEVIDALATQVAASADADAERAALTHAVAALYALAAMQTPIGADQPGNVDDGGVRGQMDCIDHSTNTTRFLELLAARGALRFHRVLPPTRRGWVFAHHTARLAALADGAEFAVDSWYVGVGEPPLVVPMTRWLAGEMTP